MTGGLAGCTLPKKQKKQPPPEKACRETEDALLQALPEAERDALTSTLRLTGLRMAALCGIHKQEDEFDV